MNIINMQNIQNGGCYNKEVSLLTYIIGSISSIYLIFTKNKSYKITGSFFLLVYHKCN